MPRKKRNPGEPHQQPVGRTPSALPRQQAQKPVSQPMQLSRSRLLSHLNDAVGACDDLFAEHGEDCECETCRLVSNLVGGLRVFVMLLQIT
jgi:hypothetical protein